jgi:hypothetical protein
MKKTLTGYCVLLLSSLIFVSSTCGKGPAPLALTIIGKWDYTSLSTTIIDSTGLNGYNEHLSDTGFSAHSQNSYQLKSDSTVIYTDYTITPNIVKSGIYTTINIAFPYAYPGGMSGDLILQFQQSTSDTLNFVCYPNELQFIEQVDSAHILSRHTKNYTPD